MFDFFRKHDDSILVATRHEQKDAIERLIQQGTLGSGYYLLLVLSILIVTPGLLLNNASVVIGGMLLAPLMVPILSLSLSLVSGSLPGLLRSLWILTVSIVLTLVTAAGITTVLGGTNQTSIAWISADITPGIYIFIAFCSGVAGSFAWVKEHLSSSIAGVAVAVSLLPPLCAVGIGLTTFNGELIRNAGILFLANLVGICMAGFLVFWLLGFIDTTKVEEKVIEKFSN